MRPFWLIVLATLLGGTLPAAADEVALSMVHGHSRIDIPASAITSIEASAIISFVTIETQERHDYPYPRVELCYTPEIQTQICQLTRRILELPMILIVDCEPVSMPVVREALCGPCLQISANDLVEAKMLAQRLRKGSNRRCAPLS